MLLLPDVWVQHSKGAINKCLKCKRRGGFKKALGLGRELKDLAARKVDMRTITVNFPCELCWIKQKNLKYCVRHGHDERKVLVHEPDPRGLGDETMSHADYEKVGISRRCPARAQCAGKTVPPRSPPQRTQGRRLLQVVVSASVRRSPEGLLISLEE